MTRLHLYRTTSLVWSLIIVSVLFFCVQAQRTKPLAKPNAETSLQKNTRLTRVEFGKDSRSVSYFFKSGAVQRIVTYRVDADSSLAIEVKPTRAGKPFLELFSTRTGVRARTPGGEYQLIKGKRVLPANTDSLSLWLVANNIAAKSATSPRSVYDRAIKELAKTSKTKVLAVNAYVQHTAIFSDTVVNGMGGDWTMPGGSNGGGDCTPGDATCTEIDVSGNTDTFNCHCDCGVPVCYEVMLSAQIQVLLRDESTGAETIYTETVHFTKCIFGGCTMPVEVPD